MRRRDYELEWHRKRHQSVQTIESDPIRFAREHLDFHPDEKQAQLLTNHVHRGLLNCTRQWGKSTVTAAKAVHHALHHPESLTLIVTPGARQSGIFLSKIEHFMARLGIRPKRDGINPISVKFPNNARIVGLPGKEATIRGFSQVSLMIIDEAARVPDQLYEAVIPMLAIGNGDLILMSTPNGNRGFFHHEWTYGGPRWERIQVPATECPRISPAFLEEQRKNMPDRTFRQEFLCEFAEMEGALFTEEMIQRAFSDKVKPLDIRLR